MFVGNQFIECMVCWCWMHRKSSSQKMDFRKDVVANGVLKLNSMCTEPLEGKCTNSRHTKHSGFTIVFFLDEPCMPCIDVHDGGSSSLKCSCC